MQLLHTLLFMMVCMYACMLCVCVCMHYVYVTKLEKTRLPHIFVFTGLKIHNSKQKYAISLKFSPAI